MTARTSDTTSRETLRAYIAAFLGGLKDTHADPEDVRAVLNEFLGNEEAPKPIGRVLTQAEQGPGYDPQQKVIHFPDGHPAEGTNLYAAPPSSSEALQVLVDLRTELAEALQAGKIAPDVISTELGRRMAQLLEKP